MVHRSTEMVDDGKPERAPGGARPLRQAPRADLTRKFDLQRLDAAPERKVRLMSTSFVSRVAGFATVSFVAAVVHDAEEFRGCIARRCGRMAAATAQIRLGYDQYDAVAVWLVSEQVSDMLASAAAQPGSPEFRAVLVVLQHRIPS